MSTAVRKTKTAIVKLRVTEEQRDAMYALAKAHGKTLSAYLRDLSLGASSPPRAVVSVQPPASDLERLSAEFARTMPESNARALARLELARGRKPS